MEKISFGQLNFQSVLDKMHEELDKAKAELLAEETIDSVHFGDSGVTYYYTLDGKEFTDKAKAIRHQIDYLMEEIKE